MIHNQVRNPRKESTAQLLKRPMWGVLLDPMIAEPEGGPSSDMQRFED
jgi:hypothetical protein